MRAGDAAGNWSGWGTGRSITIRLGTPVAPTLLSPQNASSTTDASPELDWSDVVYGDRYRLQISKRSDFSTVVLSVLLPAGVTTYTPGTDLAPGTYYWRVCARNVGGTLSAWSITWRVIILAP